MKIGVITHWNCFENYGQILQGYAFQQFLKARGHEPFIIKYFPGGFFSGRRSLRRSLYFLGSFKSAWRGVRNLLLLSHWRNRRRKERISRLRRFDDFRREKMVFTKNTYQTKRDLDCSSEVYADLYSVGSDVVWRAFPFTDDGSAMFLNFGNPQAKRISYSASFGRSELSDEYVRFASPYLARLQQIGVRELRGVDLCRQMGRDDAECVVDPVFLLSHDDYVEKFSIGNNRKDVMGYFLEMKPRLPIHSIETYAREIGERCKIVTVYGALGLPNRLCYDPTISEWVRDIGEAKLLVTNSFHGTSLAILLHTPFVVFLKHNGAGMDDRLISLLTRFNLLDRVYDYQHPNLERISATEIDWSMVDRCLENYKSLSIEFLKRAGI